MDNKTTRLVTNRQIIPEHLEFEDLLSSLFEELAKVPFAGLDLEIARALEMIGHFFGADCCGLLEVLPDRRQIQVVNLSRRELSEASASATDVVTRSRWLYHRMVEKGEPVVFSSLESLPSEVNGERASWERSGIGAMLMLPLGNEGRVAHLIGIWSNGRGQEWPASCSRRLRLLGEILARDLIHRRDREALLRSKQDLAEAYSEIQESREQRQSESQPLPEERGSWNEFRDIVGASDALNYVLFKLQQVAGTKTTVLLTGETGTGKGLFARALHEASDRKAKPFVNVNCAGLPANLIESELFGREKGACTGSTARQIGRFELADGGTIFLDEIGELPLDLQSKLLRVIESGEFERLGSPRTVKVDVRIVACTNRNLEQEVKEGQFRKDLFYRLNVFPITIPPLRERKQDIRLLVKFYVEKFGRMLGKGVKEVPESIMRAFENYSWPGNVRELINIIERAVITSDGSELRLTEKIDPGASDPEPGELPKGFKETGKKELVEMEREHILTTLGKIGWIIEGHNGAARILGINPSTLRSRMKKLGITRPATF